MEQLAVLVFFVAVIVFIGWLIRTSSSRNLRDTQPGRSPSSAPGGSVASPSSPASNLSEVRVRTIDLAMHMVAIGGYPDKTKAEVIKRWAKRIVSMAPKGKSEETKLELNAAIARSYGRAAHGGTSLNSLCASLSRSATERQKDKALRLCFEVASVDGMVGQPELRMLEATISLLGLDLARYREMLGATGVAEPSDPRISRKAQELMTRLGIRAGMSKVEMRKKLTAEYRKWNSRVTHPDLEIRERAKKELKLIGELRRHLIG